MSDHRVNERRPRGLGGQGCGVLIHRQEEKEKLFIHMRHYPLRAYKVTMRCLSERAEFILRKLSTLKKKVTCVKHKQKENILKTDFSHMTLIQTQKNVKH